MDGLDADVLDMMLQAIQEFADRHLLLTSCCGSTTRTSAWSSWSA